MSLVAAEVGQVTPLAATTTDTTGRFWFANVNSPTGAVLYLVASGGRPQGGAGVENPAIRLLAILGGTAGNVPNLVDLSTGGFGCPVQDGLNGSQSTTLARFATLAQRFPLREAYLQHCICLDCTRGR